MVQKRLPADVGGMVFAQYNRPVAGCKLMGAVFDARGLARQGTQTSLRTTIDVSTGVGRVMQYAEHPFVREGLPIESFSGSFPQERVGKRTRCSAKCFTTTRAELL